MHESHAKHLGNAGNIPPIEILYILAATPITSTHSLKCMNSARRGMLSNCTLTSFPVIIAVKLLKYEERLRYLNLPTLKYRRIRGDMIEVYKMFSGRYDATVTNWFTNRHVLDKKYEVRSHIFCIGTSVSNKV